jgi:hypothetical protein
MLGFYMSRLFHNDSLVLLHDGADSRGDRGETHTDATARYIRGNRGHPELKAGALYQHYVNFIEVISLKNPAL